MKFNISRSSLVAVLAFSSLTALASQAKAEEATVSMKATVPSVCLFSDLTEGNLGVDFEQKKLSSTITGVATPGKSGSITVTCSDSTTGGTYRIVSTTNASLDALPTPSTITVTASSSQGTSTANDLKGGTPVAIPDATPLPISIDIEAQFAENEPLIAGDYQFDVLLEALP